MKRGSRKLYVIKKYVMATSVKHALRQEPKAPVDSVWIDDEWIKGNAKNLADAIGFMSEPPHNEEDTD